MRFLDEPQLNLTAFMNKSLFENLRHEFFGMSRIWIESAHILLISVCVPRCIKNLLLQCFHYLLCAPIMFHIRWDGSILS